MDKEYIICANYPKCLCGFCHDCLKEKFGLDPQILSKNWSCAVCLKKCPCERCVERLEKEQNEIKPKPKDIKKIPKKEEKTISKVETKKVEKGSVTKAKQVEEEIDEKPAKTKKQIQNNIMEPKKGRKRKNAEEGKNTRPTNEKHEEVMGKGKRGKTKEEKKTAKEDNNIVKISMKQKSIPTLTMQNPYLQNTDTPHQLNQQMSYLLMPQQYSFTNQRYNPNPFPSVYMTEQGVLEEQQEKGRKRKKINKEQ